MTRRRAARPHMGEQPMLPVAVGPNPSEPAPAVAAHLQPLLAAQIKRLVPGEVSQQARAAALAFAAEAQSANTRRSYRAAIEYWQAWHLVRYGQPLACPVPLAAVLQFLADHAVRAPSAGSEQLLPGLPKDADQLLVECKVKKKRGPLKLATIEHRVSVLSHAHRLAEQRGREAHGARFQLENPCEARPVREFLQDVRRAYAKRGASRPRKKPALTAEPLAQVLATCDSSIMGLRDRALLAFAFASGGRRRSEVAAADMADLTPTAGGYTYHLGHSKTNQTAEDRAQDYKPVQGSAAQALADWLKAMANQGIHVTSGPLFRRINKAGRIGEGLTTSAIWQILKKRCALAGLSAAYSPHSLRSGFLTEAGKRKVPLPEAMAMSGHASVKTAYGYFRAGELQASEAARLLDPVPLPTAPAREKENEA